MMLRCLCLIVVLSVLPASATALGCLPDQRQSAHASERIAHYDVQLTLQDDGNLLVEECIYYDFGRRMRHGIYRDIPTRRSTESDDAEITLKLLDVRMDGHAVAYKTWMNYAGARKNFRLRIGESGRSDVSGLHAYYLRYQVADVIKKARHKQLLLYWNTIGSNWNIPIAETDSWYVLPALLDREHLSLRTTTGTTGSTTSEAAIDWPKPHRLHIHTKALPPHHGLSVEMRFDASRLPAATVMQWHFTSASWLWVVLLLNISTLGLIWLLTGREPRLPPTIFRQLLPDVEAAMAGLIVDGRVDARDIEAAILELAADGYLRMEEQQHGLKLIRLHKDEDTLNLYQRKLYEVLFSEGDELMLESKNADWQRLQRLQNGLKAVKSLMYKQALERGYFDTHPQHRLNTWFYLWTLIFFAEGCALYLKADIYISFIPEIIVPAAITIMLYWSGWRFLCLGHADERGGGAVLLLLAMLAGWGLGFSWLAVNLPLTLMLLICGLFIAAMPRRGIKGVLLHAHIRKLRKQLSDLGNKALRDQMAAHPDLATRLLPFAVALGLKENMVWFGKHAHLRLPPYYRGSWSTMTGSLYCLSTTSGGNASAGGSGAGGGFGGGGGGSW